VTVTLSAGERGEAGADSVVAGPPGADSTVAGPQGPSGTTAVTSPLTRSGSAENATIGLDTSTLEPAGLSAGTKTELSATYAPTMLAEAGNLLRKLELGQTDVCLQIIGDSTALGTIPTDIRWPYKLGEFLATRYPAVTVLIRMWNATNISYDAAFTINAGTGLQTLTIYNGAASGMGADYSRTNIVALTPAAPDLTIIAHGHNDTPTNFVKSLPQLARAVRTRWPLGTITLMAQNPQGTALAQYADQMKIRELVGSIAAGNGFGFIDSTTVFLKASGWESTLVSSDGVHPTPAGYTLWAKSLEPFFTFAGNGILRASRPLSDRIWLDASQFGATNTSAQTGPVYSTSGGPSSATAIGATWAFSPTSSDNIAAWLTIPEDWNSWNTFLFATVLSGVGGNLGTSQWTIGSAPLNLGGSPASVTFPFSVGYPTGMGVRGTVHGSGDGGKIMRADWLATNAQYNRKGLHALVVNRIAENAGDTLAVPSHFKGILFERID
jgi:lysophospholipase L1-like esterase